jgi:RimJ/RimL family protein N-acetyltransferase
MSGLPIIAWSSISDMTAAMFVETPRLLIRALSVSDLDSYSAMMSDPLVVRFLGDGTPESREACLSYIQSCLRSQAEHGYSRYAVVERRSDSLIGLCGYKQTEDGIDLGWRVSRPHWGQGYATESAAAVLEYGLNDLDLSDVYCICATQNVASIRVAEKIGMIFDCVDHVGGWTVRRYRAPREVRRVGP